MVLSACRGPSYRGLKAVVVGCECVSVIAGALPESLGQLRSLQTLDLHQNRLSGAVGCAPGTLKRSSRESPALLLGGLGRIWGQSKCSNNAWGPIGLDIVEKALQSRYLLHPITGVVLTRAST